MNDVERVNGVLRDTLALHGSPPSLAEAMRYAVLGGGKRIRARLVYATGRLVGAAESVLDRPAAAVELIHAYSLVHDDLPAMDDDDLRRASRRYTSGSTKPPPSWSATPCRRWPSTC